MGLTVPRFLTITFLLTQRIQAEEAKLKAQQEKNIGDGFVAEAQKRVAEEANKYLQFKFSA